MLSRRAAGIQPSGIRRIFELVASMEDPINLSIGQAHFDVPEAVKDAAIEAMVESGRADPLGIKRLKKQKLALKDKISTLENQLFPDIIA